MSIISPVLACATCFGDPNSALTKGLTMGMATLLGVTVVVLGGIVAGAITLAIRARRHALVDAAGQDLVEEISP